MGWNFLTRFSLNFISEPEESEPSESNFHLSQNDLLKETLKKVLKIYLTNVDFEKKLCLTSFFSSKIGQKKGINRKHVHSTVHTWNTGQSYVQSYVTYNNINNSYKLNLI